MARRNRTTPAVGKSIAMDTLERFGLVIDRKNDGTVIKRNVRLNYKIANRDSDGEMIDSITERVKFRDLPRSIKRAVKELQAEILAHAEAQGHIGAGTDDDELV